LNRHARRAQQKTSGKVPHEQITATFARAVEHHRGGDLDGAEELYRRVLTWSPDSPEPWNYLGAIALARGDMPKAEQRYAKALALRRDWPEVLNAHGNVLHALGRFEEAARDLYHAVKIDAFYHQAWNSLGINLQYRGDLEKAHEYFDRACELAPRTSRYLFNRGMNFKHQKRLAEAREAFTAALAVDADYVDAVCQMAHCFRIEGNDAEAVRWYQRYLELAPEDAAGARTFLAARTGSASIPAPSPVYIRQLFDSYAHTFDRHLQEKLDYHLPEFLERSMRDRLATRGSKVTLLDLGCGTGLAGAAFAPHARRLVGVDLSGGMLARARERRIYDELVEADVVEYLRRGDERFDLVVAAELFNYMGDLAPVLAALRPRMRDDGWLAFSVESGAADGVQLGQSLRFTHGEAYVRESLAGARFDVESVMREVIRRQEGEPVAGFVVLARPRH
jgi:predicted TPR repeat methyltransferase